MFIPEQFRESDLERLHEFVECNSFGILASSKDGETQATHLPFLLDRDSGEFGLLSGHIARANSHWKALDSARALVIFQGPHSYISPSWYESQKGVVPTWNYIAVHVSGTVQLLNEPDEILGHLRQSVDYFESSQPSPWSMDSQDLDYLEKLAHAVVAFKLNIEQIEGKWKLSQNHNETRRRRIVAALEGQNQPSQPVIADWMAADLNQQGTKNRNNRN